MKEKAKKIVISFILMMVVSLGLDYLNGPQTFGGGLRAYIGLMFISGLILGPYGALGASGAHFACHLLKGYDLQMALASAFFGFAIAYLGYKLWYGTYRFRPDVTRPKLNNTSNIILFISIIIFCGILNSVLHGKMFYLIIPQSVSRNFLIEVRYFLNFINSSFIFGIIGIWISNKKNFVHIPSPSKNSKNEKFYKFAGALLVLSVIAIVVIDSFIHLNDFIVMIELIILSLLLVVYFTKPITSNIIINDSKSILEEVMNRFHLAVLTLLILGLFISLDSLLITYASLFLPLDENEVIFSLMVVMDILLLIFYIPSLAVLRYIENRVIVPILSFSRIEDFIHENEKIETEGLVEIYSRYIDDETEIGRLSRSYTELIEFNNNYIENIREIEGERERIEAELDIANRIQAANLPREAIVNDNYAVDGYSHPAKEVGGDFFYYYELDDELLAIVIGDVSGKGVPAAILAVVTQAMIKQMLENIRDPSRILYSLNNQLCENNSESMFTTVWLGIYNKTTGKLVFSNAGHNPPLIKENGEFKHLNIDSGLVLGLMEDFEYVMEEITLSDEIVLFTDGITDACNNEKEMYGDDRLLNFFNEFKSDEDPIMPLLNDIHEFTQDAEQFDDMTVLCLKKWN